MTSQNSDHVIPIPHSAPSTFRLLKTKILSSVPSKSKPFHSAKLPWASSSSSRNLYLFPGFNSSSDQMDHISNQSNLSNEKKVTLIRQRSKSNNTFNPSQEPQTPSTLSSPHIGSNSDSFIDPANLIPLLEPLTNRPSTDLLIASNPHDSVTPQSINHLSLQSNNRLVLELNSNRLNYPSFNNKAASSNGPRVLRLVGQQPENQSAHTTSSPRPTPIPHGGSGAILSIHPPQLIRSTTLSPALSLLDPSVSQPDVAGTPTLNIICSPPPGSSIQDSNKPSSPRVNSSYQLFNPSRASQYCLFDQNYIAKDVASPNSSKDNSPDIIPQLPLSNPPSTSEKPTISTSVLPSDNNAITSGASQLISTTPSSLSKSFSGTIAALETPLNLDLAEFSNYLSFSDASPPLQPANPHSHSKPGSNSNSHLSRAKLSFTTTHSTIPRSPTSSHTSSPTITPVQVKSSSSPLSPSCLPTLDPSQPSKLKFTPPTICPVASTPSATVSPLSIMLSPGISSISTYSNAPPSPSSQLDKSLKLVVPSTMSGNSSSPSSPSHGPQSVSPSESSSISLEPASELEKARQIIIGLQNEVKQLQDASSEPNRTIPPSPTSNKSHLSNSVNCASSNNAVDDTKESKLDLVVDHDLPSLSTVQTSLNQKLPESSVTSVSLPTTVPMVLPLDATLDPASEDELDPASKPSRLPIAKHRVRDVAAVKPSSHMHSRNPSGGSTLSRTLKLSLDSNGSTEYQYATSQSHSTYRTTPSSISTYPKPKLQPISTKTSAPFSGSSRARSPQSEVFWPRTSLDTVHPSSSQVTGASERSKPGHEIPRQSHLSRAPSFASQSSASSDQLARSYAHMAPSHHPNGSISSSHDQASYKRDHASDSLSENHRHRRHRDVHRSGLSSVEEDIVLSEEPDEHKLNTMTKVELLNMLKNHKSQFAIERQELLDALRQSREKFTQANRELQRLRAEDGWKTEQLNAANEEVSWLSRLASTLELEKSNLEDQLNSMANELMQASGGSKKASIPTPRSARTVRATGNSFYSRSPKGMDNSSNRSSDEVPMSQSSLKSYSPKTPSAAVHRASHKSQDSVRTICANEPNSRVYESQSHSHLPNAINKWRAQETFAVEPDVPSRGGSRQHNNVKNRHTPQRSESDFRMPLTTSNLRSMRTDRENASSRQRSHRAPSQSQSSVVRRKHAHYQESASGSFVNHRNDTSSVDDRDDNIDFPSHRNFHNSDYIDQDEPLDYQDVAYDIDNHKIRSRNDSSESLAISPSSTVFADHQRNNLTRISSLNRGFISSNRNPDSRNSLMSLQLRPEDELFLENYLDDDEILSDEEF